MSTLRGIMLKLLLWDTPWSILQSWAILFLIDSMQLLPTFPLSVLLYNHLDWSFAISPHASVLRSNLIPEAFCCHYFQKLGRYLKLTLNDLLPSNHSIVVRGRSKRTLLSGRNTFLRPALIHIYSVWPLSEFNYLCQKFYSLIILKWPLYNLILKKINQMFHKVYNYGANTIGSKTRGKSQYHHNS